MKKWASNYILICALCAISFSVQAGWCEGSKYWVMDMSLPEQLEKAKQTGDDTMKALRLGKAQLKTDKKTLKQLRNRYTQLSQETVALCQQNRRTEFPVHYQGVTLETQDELRLRVNLNFVLLQAQRNAEIRAVKYYKEVDKLEQDLVDSHAMLALLKRQQATQSDINSDPLQVRQFVQSSCHAVKRGQSLLNEVRNVNVGSFLENIIQSEAPTSVSEATLDHFMSDCRVNSGSMSRSEDGWIIRNVRSLSEWF